MGCPHRFHRDDGTKIHAVNDMFHHRTCVAEIVPSPTRVHFAKFMFRDGTPSDRTCVHKAYCGSSSGGVGPHLTPEPVGGRGCGSPVGPSGGWIQVGGPRCTLNAMAGPKVTEGPVMGRYMLRQEGQSDFMRSSWCEPNTSTDFRVEGPVHRGDG